MPACGWRELNLENMKKIGNWQAVSRGIRSGARRVVLLMLGVACTDPFNSIAARGS